MTDAASPGNGRIDGLETRMDKVEADIRELRALVIHAIAGETPGD
ncbi:MAG: hypothetical protein OXG04_04195 [Acidobacteria bacterium]|nr:hypothetical protein [Acidobacteriota bacterium]